MKTIRLTILSRWLLRLRWLALVGKLAVCALTWFALGVSLPWPSLSLIFGVEFLSVVFLEYILRRRGNLDEKVFGKVLVLDTLVLYFILAVTGGPANPFSIWFLVHIALAAVVLNATWTWIIAALSSICFGLLFAWHLPLPGSVHSGHMHHAGDSFSLHLQGMLIAFILTALFLGYFIAKIAQSLKIREEQIRELERKRLNELRLTSLSTLAVGAAHELATPLSTVELALGELESKYNERQQDNEEIAMIRKQLRRCRDVLDNMGATVGEMKGEFATLLDLKKAIHEIVDTLPPDSRKRVKIEARTVRIELFLPPSSFKFSLLAMLKNALDASSEDELVVVHLSEENQEVRIEVIDNGDGMDQPTIERAVDPFFTTKSSGKGLGLGLFLVKSFAEQNKGQFHISSSQGAGTKASLVFERKNFSMAV